MKTETVNRGRFVCYFWYLGWDHISLGLHVCPTLPNIEIHLPGGYIRIGWHDTPMPNITRYKGFGWGHRYPYYQLEETP